VRRGLSLLEVLVALAIFLLSLTAISQLINHASNRAIDTELRTHAGRICQSKLNEVLSGGIPLSPQSDTPDENEPDFNWSLDAEQAAVTGLWSITVKVSWTRPDGGTDSCSVSQMMIDPSIRGSTQDVPTAPTASTTSGTSGDQTGAGSTQSGAGATPAAVAGATGNKPGATTPAAPKATAPAAAPKATTPSTKSNTPTKVG
jgi:prepilin-type N-terminal cleavage/methylation domain-containing protein